MKRQRLLPLGLAFLVASCSGNSGPSTPADAAQAGPGEIVQVDDYPLFSMRTTTDYGFDAYRRGATGAGSWSAGPSAGSSARFALAARRAPHGAEAALRASATRARESWACTCFSTASSGEGPLFGRNFDWWNRASLILHTAPPNALASFSMVDLYYLDFPGTVGLEALRAQRDRIAQRAPYLPFDGVNEKGVAIGQMAVPSAEAPFDPAKVSLYDLALIRLVLDYATDTGHALELLRGHNYRVTSPAVHFLIADRSGSAAIVEYVAGEMRVTRNSTPFLVSTNFVVSGSQAPFSTGCWRYDRAHATLAARDGVLSRAEAFDLLSAVSQGSTMWSAVYSMREPAIEVVPGRRYGRSYRFTMAASR